MGKEKILALVILAAGLLFVGCTKPPVYTPQKPVPIHVTSLDYTEKGIIFRIPEPVWIVVQPKNLKIIVDKDYLTKSRAQRFVLVVRSWDKYETTALRGKKANLLYAHSAELVVGDEETKDMIEALIENMKSLALFQKAPQKVLFLLDSRVYNN